MVSLRFNWGTLTNGTAYFEVIESSQAFDICEETHFQFAIFIWFEELFEALFEDRVTKWTCHHIKASCHVKAWFHLDYTHLVKSCYKYVYNDACLLGSVCTFVIELDSSLEILCVLIFFLDVIMTSDFHLQIFIDDFSRTDCDCTSHQIYNSWATGTTTWKLKDTDGDV